MGLRLLFLMLAAAVVCCVPAFAGDALERGIAEFREDRLEEALALFEEALKERPDDPNVLLNIGMVQRELQNQDAAIAAFERVLAIRPEADTARRYLADMLLSKGKSSEAQAVLQPALQRRAQPYGEFVFLNGLILAKLGKTDEAMTAFIDAKALDSRLGQQADFQIATLQVAKKDYSAAQKSFRGLITQDPNSHWALFSEDYLQALEKMPPKWRLIFGTGLQYDDNVFAIPDNPALVDTDRKADWKSVSYWLGEATVFESGPFNLKASYGGNYSRYFHKNYEKREPGQTIFSLDTINHTVSLMPSYNTQSSVSSLLLSYAYWSVDYTTYQQTLTVSPSHTFVLADNHLGQVMLRYRKTDSTFDWSVKKFGRSPDPSEDRDSNNYAAGLGYFFTFLDGNALLSVRAEFDKNDADGRNWDYTGYKASAGLLIPIVKNAVKFNLYGEYYYQQYDHDNTMYGIKRRDETWLIQPTLTFELSKNVDFNIGYAYISEHSNIAVYKYNKNLFTFGLEFKLSGR